jgi:hypothetical protein
VLANDKRAIFSAAAHAQRAADYLHDLQPQQTAEERAAANTTRSSFRTAKASFSMARRNTRSLLLKVSYLPPEHFGPSRCIRITFWYQTMPTNIP